MLNDICKVKTDSQEKLKNLQTKRPIFLSCYEPKGMKSCSEVPRIQPVKGKAKRQIHARYPFLGGGTYQPPVLSVLYLQMGY